MSDVKSEAETNDSAVTFGFDPTTIGLRHRSWWVIVKPDEDDSDVGAVIGDLCVRARDGGSNDIDAEAIRKPNYHATREDGFDCTYRYYWFKPLSPTSPPAEALPTSGAETVVSLKVMKLSDDRSDYFVSIERDGREVTPHVFREEYKAAYHVALYRWLLCGGEEPDLIAFGPDDWPAIVSVAKAPEPAGGGVREGMIDAGAIAIRQSRVAGITPPEEGTDYDRKLAKACLDAALPLPALLPEAEAAPDGVDALRIKPLVWCWNSGEFVCETEGGLYRIEDNGPNWTSDRYWLFVNAGLRGERRMKFASLVEAQCAARAIYEARIRSALVPEQEVQR